MARRPANPRTNDVEYYLEKAAGLAAARKPDRAVRVLADGLKNHRADLRLSLRLGAIEMARGKPDRAIRVLQDALRAHPGQPDLLYQLGAMHLSVGDGYSAVNCLEPVAAAHPDEIQVQESYGAALSMQGHHMDALAVFEQAAGLPAEPEQTARLQYHAALVLQELSRADEALDILTDLRKSYPDNTEYMLTEAKLQSDLGNADVTSQQLNAVLSADPGNVDAFILLHKISLRDPDPDALEQIDTFLRDTSVTDRNKTNLDYLAGEILDRLGDRSAAFDRFVRANRARKEIEGGFDLAGHADLIERTKRTFDRELMSKISSETVDGEGPIFIVGMPRSGTSLVEQIIASHEGVYGAGEREDIRLLSNNLGPRLGVSQPYPENVESLTAQTASLLADDYLESVSANAVAGQRISDKMPRNFLSAGFIRLLFPGAPIVHCVRDPLDTCLSCFMTNFGRRQLFSTDLSDLGAYYNAYLDIMKHWESVLDPPLYSIRYEDLVADPQAEIPKLIEYCGLPWDENCLTPHLADRAVVTASRWQVRSPIYRSSVSKAEKYRDHLGELIGALEIAD